MTARDLVIIFVLIISGTSAFAGERVAPIPAPALDDANATDGTQTAVLSGGCYWGMQSVFEHVAGIGKVTAGFSGIARTGGDIDRFGRVPSEAVEIVYDPHRISYGRILQLFFSVAHDPTQVDRQGPDAGPQYRSVIYYSDELQRKIAQGYMAQLNAAHVFAAPIATEIVPLVQFRRVADSQQHYAAKHPDSPYVAMVDAPKLGALKAMFPALYRESPPAQ
ncbi:MAG TPA: peptide-methionine (S)-S-oxide reductase [Rhizomicrobium sp.]